MNYHCFPCWIQCCENKIQLENQKGEKREVSVLQFEVYLGRLGGERFSNSSLSRVQDLCILLQKKIAEGAMSLYLYCPAVARGRGYIGEARRNGVKLGGDVLQPQQVT